MNFFQSILLLLALYSIAAACVGSEREKTPSAPEQAVPLDSEPKCPYPKDTILLPTRRLATIAGRVVNEGPWGDEEISVPGVRIIVNAVGGKTDVWYQTSTGVDGEFSFRGISSGRYHLRTCLEEWDAVELDIEIEIEIDSSSKEPGLLLAIEPS